MSRHSLYHYISKMFGLKTPEDFQEGGGRHYGIGKMEIYPCLPIRLDHNLEVARR